jgi:hypothetical protein
VTETETATFDRSGLESRDTRERRKALALRLRQVEWHLANRDHDANGAVVVSKAADALEVCTTRPVGAWLFPGGGDNKLARGVCRNRLCPHCHRIRMGRLGDSLAELVKEEFKLGHQLAVITLTVKHSRFDRLKQVKKDASAAWAKLTKRAFWKALVEEYHRVAEVERTGKSGWHPHFHILVRLAFNRAAHQQAWRDGKLQQGKLFQWWAAREYGRGWRRRVLVDGTVTGEVAARFLSLTPHDLKLALESEWREVTSSLGRASDQVELQLVRRGLDPDTVLHPKTGKPRPVEKFVAELVKYTTKGSGKGGKGKQGLMDYAPAVMAEYITGIKHWRLHQSARGWSKIAKEFEREDLEAEQEARDKQGARFIPFVNLVVSIEESISGTATTEVKEQTIRDGIEFMKLWRTACADDDDFDRHNLSVLEDCLGRLLGADGPARWIFDGWKLSKRDERRVLDKLGLMRGGRERDENGLLQRAGHALVWASSEDANDWRADRAARKQAELERLDYLLEPVCVGGDDDDLPPWDLTRVEVLDHE